MAGLSSCTRDVSSAPQLDHALGDTASTLQRGGSAICGGGMPGGSCTGTGFSTGNGSPISGGGGSGVGGRSAGGGISGFGVGGVVWAIFIGVLGVILWPASRRPG